jgi:glycosyltransferase involved in cell wall biosynthesis
MPSAPQKYQIQKQILGTEAPNIMLANQQGLDLLNDPSTIQDNPSALASGVAVTLLTGGIDRPYAFGLSMALASKGVMLDVIGGSELDSAEIQEMPSLNFIKLHEDQRQAAGAVKRFLRVAIFYLRLIYYAARAKPQIFHILWNYKFPLFDRTLLMLYYKILGKRIVFTAHNVNAAERDGDESVLNRLSLRSQYRLADHIFVHTDKMKHSLLHEFGVKEEAVSVIPFGINNSVPDTELTPKQAKQQLGIGSSEKTILFFGRIRPYKGLDYLVAAFRQLALQDESYRLIIAGEPKKESLSYWREIQETIERQGIGKQIIERIGFLADEQTELYFKAADVLILPYKEVFQSGVLFLAYSFGLPVIATDVGSLRDDIVEGETGYLCKPCDEVDLSRTIGMYFESELYQALDHRRSKIKDIVGERNSWGGVADKTCNVYAQLLAK